VSDEAGYMKNESIKEAAKRAANNGEPVCDTSGSDSQVLVFKVAVGESKQSTCICHDNAALHLWAIKEVL
jgi:hypothetical protein